MADLREEMLEGLVQYFKAGIEKHRVNVEILLEKRVGVAEHPDVMETIEGELAKMAELDDKISVLRTYF